MEIIYVPISLTLDGDQWCALVGENIQSGEAAFASSPVEALSQLAKRISASQNTSDYIKIGY